MIEPGNDLDSKKPPETQILIRDEQLDEVADFFADVHPFYTRLIVYIILFFVFCALLWAGFGKVDIVAVAPFQLIPFGRVKIVQAPRMGEIESIEVMEGDQVIKGQKLFLLRSRETWIEFQELEYAKIQLRQAKYDVQETFPLKRQLIKEKIAGLEARLNLIQMAMQTHQEALQAYRENGGASKSVSDDNGYSSDLQEKIKFRSAELDYLKVQYEQSLKLFEKGLVSRVKLEETRVRYFGALAELPNRLTEINRQEMVIQDLKQQILEAHIELDQESSKVTRAFEEAQLRYERASRSVDRTLEAESDLIVAPTKGVVTQVNVNTIGQVVKMGQALATVAPNSVPIVAELKILNKDVGLIKLGQVVKLKYDAFAFEDYGIKTGILKKVAPDAIVDPVLGPVYRGIVELQEKSVWASGEEKRLVYGLKGSAEIITDRQSILMHLLRPLRRLLETATFSPEESDG